MRTNTKILLVEDHEIVRKGIHALLTRNSDFAVVGEASDGSEAIKCLESVSPDLVLMDMNMPVMNGMECTKYIKKKFPGIKVLVLSMHDHENYLIEMLEAGADGYILKNSTNDELIFAIKKVLNRGKYIGSELALSLIEKIKLEKNKTWIQENTLDLSEREKKVLELIADGLTNAEIADKLFTSIRTIETRRKRLLEKTGTINTASLIRYAVRSRLIE
jgi:DNA-binding NarL/FixJ family response regulator